MVRSGSVSSEGQETYTAYGEETSDEEDDEGIDGGLASYGTRAVGA